MCVERTAARNVLEVEFQTLMSNRSHRLQHDLRFPRGCHNHWPVSKPTPGQDENQECWHPKGNEVGQVYARHVHGSEERYPDSRWGIDTGMQQIRDEDASSGVVEDPSEDDCQCQNEEKEDREVCEEIGDSRAWPSPLVRRQEARQVPERPQNT